MRAGPSPTLRPVYKALHRRLTVWGVDRRLFFLALLMGAATFNLFYSFLAGLLMFVRLLWAVRRPKGWVQIGATGLMVLYLGFSLALLLPQPRAYAITMVGQAQRMASIGSGPHLFTVTPGRPTTR